MNDDTGVDELFHDEKSMEEFMELLASVGLVISTVAEGLVIGVTADKLKELMAAADEDPSKKVVIFIKNSFDDKSGDDELPN